MNVPDKDWKALIVKLTGDRVYPFSIEGENLNYPIGHIDRHFRWRIPGKRWDRFDLSDADISTEAKQRLQALGVL